MRNIFIITFFIIPFFTFSQSKKMTPTEYIAKYKDLAMKEMKRVGVPASITLAQGLLESGNGNSKLATKANNHFGIKCHSDWKGPSMRKDDDKKNECFRKYKNAYQSYIDHSDFLKNKSRYASLFELKPTDYKGWAKGLKKAGYATNPKYPQLLIQIIEKNELYKYDEMVLKGKTTDRKEKGKQKDKKETNTVPKKEEPTHDIPRLANEESFEIDHPGRKLHQNNKVDYIVVKKGDTFYSIAKEFNLALWQLYQYNDLKKGAVLQVRQVIYVQAKKNKAERKYSTHIMRTNETLQEVAQLYGVKLARLYKLNNLKKGETLKKGDVVNLRKKKVRY